MKVKVARINSPTKFWGKTDWDNWKRNVIPQLRYDGIRCDSEEIKVDTYRVRVDDEGED